MLTTSDPAGTRAALDALAIAYEEHDAGADAVPDGFAGVRDGLAQRGIDVEAR
jgi:hypothetical protein